MQHNRKKLVFIMITEDEHGILSRYWLSVARKSQYDTFSLVCRYVQFSMQLNK